MSADWLETLNAAGARMDDGMPVDFGDPDGELAAAAGGDVITALTDYGVIAATGSDAGTLLQGQLTTDIREVDATHSRLGAICSPKGRMLASIRIIAHEGGYLLVLPAALLAGILQRLRMYVLRADVQLEDVSSQWAVLGLRGPAVAAAAGIGAAALEGAADDAIAVGNGVAVRLLDASLPRFLLVVPVGTAASLFTACAAAGRPVGREAWTLTEVEAAVPEVHPETQDAFVPQMVNLQALQGVSFTKGCYAGQEVVARMQYLGKLKRRMFRARVAVAPPPEAGTPLYAPTAPGGQSVGKVVSAVRHPEGGTELLAVIQIEAAEQDSIHLAGPDGPPLELLDLPYPLDA